MKIEEFENLFKTGIYKITCLANNKVYVGSACSTKAPSKKKRGFFSRWYTHTRQLRGNKHPNQHLQYAWNKYGEDSFRFEILEFCDPEIGIEREQYYMKLYNVCDHSVGFNIINQSNFKNTNYLSKDHKTKISQALTGKKRPLNVVQKWSKKVQQIDKNTLEIINEFYSMAEAFRQTGVQRQDIGKVCAGINKSAGGYYWKIVKDIV